MILFFMTIVYGRDASFHTCSFCIMIVENPTDSPTQRNSESLMVYIGYMSNSTQKIYIFLRELQTCSLKLKIAGNEESNDAPNISEAQHPTPSRKIVRTFILVKI